MSKRENKRIRQLERRVEKLEQALYGGRVPDYQIQVTAGGTPEMLDELGKKLAESIQKAFSVPASKAKASEPMEVHCHHRRGRTEPCKGCGGRQEREPSC